MCPLKTQDWRQITSKWPVIFFFSPFVHSLSPEFSAPLTCSERLAPWSSCPLCGGDSAPLTDKVLFSMFRKPQGNVLSHFTVFSISACLAGKRSNLCLETILFVCLFVCSVGLELAGMKARLSLGLWSGKMPPSPPGKHLSVQPLSYLASLSWFPFTPSWVNSYRLVSIAYHVSDFFCPFE